MAATTRYEATPEPPSEKPVHVSATVLLPEVAVAVPLLGGVASRTIEAFGLVAAAVVLPSLSRRNTVTVLVPFPAASVHALVVAKVSNAVHVLVFVTHIWPRPLASLAVIASVTAAVWVAPAPPLILTVPVGGVVSAELAASAAESLIRGLLIPLRGSTICLPVEVSRASCWSTDSAGNAPRRTANAPAT